MTRTSGREANTPRQTGYAVRFSIVALIFLLIFVYFAGGYWHARRRIRKGLAPLPYHRWMVRRQLYAARPMNNPQPYYENRGDSFHQAYSMQGYAAPPPAYNPEHAPPPTYQPPQGGSKVAADQSFQATFRQGESSEGPALPATPTQAGGPQREL